MERTFPVAAVWAMVGFVVGVLAGTGVSHWLPNPYGLASLTAGIICACTAAWIGARGGAVAFWSAALAAAVGGLSFLAGFAGPILFRPDLPQGPLLGIFLAGPVGIIVGALLGALLGVVVKAATVPSLAAQRSRDAGATGIRP